MNTNDRGDIGRAFYPVFPKFCEHPFRVRESSRIGGEGSEPVLLEQELVTQIVPGRVWGASILGSQHRYAARPKGYRRRGIVQRRRKALLLSHIRSLGKGSES